jgi:hypothetical protein
MYVFTELPVLLLLLVVCVLYVLVFDVLIYWLKSQFYIKFNKQKLKHAFWNSSDESGHFVFAWSQYC